MDEIYTTIQIACMLNVNAETVRRWLRTGKLKGYFSGSKKGGFIIKETDLEEFIKKHPKYRKVKPERSRQNTFTLESLDKRILELEESITSLRGNLDELIEIRDMLKNGV